MKTIEVKTQNELDKLPYEFEEYTIIKIVSKEIIQIAKIYLNSSVEAYNNTSVVALNNSNVAAYNNTSVVAYDTSNVVAYNNSSVVAFDNSNVVAHSDSSVEAYNNTSVVAYETSNVVAYDTSSVRAYGNSSVEAFDNSSIMAHGNSSVVAYDNSSVEAYDGSRVVVYDNSSVEALNNSSIMAHDNSSVRSYGTSRVVAYGNSNVVAYGNSSARAHDNSSVEAHDNSSVRAHGNSNIDLYISADVLVLSSKVVVGKLLDYSIATFKGCKENVKEKSDTAIAREVPGNIEVPFEEWLRRGYVHADGMLKKLISKKEKNGLTIFKCEDFPNKTIYIVKRDNVFSHGETLKKAIDDLKYKISDKDISKFNSWKENTKKEISLDEAIQGYRTITGACEYGVKEFVGSIQVPELLTPEIILNLTRGKFGNEKLNDFLYK